VLTSGIFAGIMLIAALSSVYFANISKQQLLHSTNKLTLVILIICVLSYYTCWRFGSSVVSAVLGEKYIFIAGFPAIISIYSSLLVSAHFMNILFMRFELLHQSVIMAGISVFATFMTCVIFHNYSHLDLKHSLLSLLFGSASAVTYGVVYILRLKARIARIATT
jgi:hypothetical protein